MKRPMKTIRTLLCWFGVPVSARLGRLVRLALLAGVTLSDVAGHAQTAASARTTMFAKMPY
jgi:hypothetical protein